MPTYNLRVIISEIYCIEGIEANSEEEAKEKADELLEGKGKHQYHDDSDTTIGTYD